MKLMLPKTACRPSIAQVAITLAMLALAACSVQVLRPGRATDSAVERGAEERPPQAGQVTLPPPWTSTSPPPTPEPIRETDTTLSADGPWLLYCGQDGWSNLLDVEAVGRIDTGALCMSQGQVAGATALAVKYGQLVQFPEGDEVRRACCVFGGWSSDGNMALLSDLGLRENQTNLIVYDVEDDRLHRIVRSEFQITPLGLSPAGSWAVYLEEDANRQAPPARQSPASVMAVSTDGQRVRELYRLFDAEDIENTVLGWISDSSLLLQRSDRDCGRQPQHLELLYADLEQGTARHIFDQHSHAAFDPATQTILLTELLGETCEPEVESGQLLRLTAADGWRPHAVPVPREWGEQWAVSQIEWHPELGQFSARIGENRGEPPLHLITLDPAGTIRLEFPMGGVQDATSPRMFPSPYGDLILVGAAAPHGTLLYTQGGYLIKSLTMEGGGLRDGLRAVQWLTENHVIFMMGSEQRGIYRAAAAEGWEPALVEPWAVRGSEMILVQAPVRPFRFACDGADPGRQYACRQSCGEEGYTRLDIGDQLMVSYEPPLASRLRAGPGFDGQVITALDPGEQAEVVGGPVCSDGHVWWHLEPQDMPIRGWAAEGDAEGAWLLPFGPPKTARPLPTPQPVRPTPTPRPRILTPTPGPGSAVPFLPTPTPLGWPAATPTPGRIPVSPTPTPQAWASATPTAGAPDARLSPHGPWLVGLGADEVLALDADGSHRAALRLHGALDLEADLASGIADFGAWLAFRTHETFLRGPNALLRIFRLPNTEPVYTIPMLSDALAQRAGFPWESRLQSSDPALPAVAASPLVWSPNGWYLAFVGALDGPSADVYVFSPRTYELLRLTDGPNQAVLMGWSPDGRWVVHMEAEFPVEEGGAAFKPVAVWAADVQGGSARYLYPSRGQLGVTETIVGWLSDREFVAAERDAIGRLGRLARVDVQSGSYQLLYAGEVFSAAVDPRNKTLAFIPYDPSFFPPQGHAALENPTPTPRPVGQGAVPEGGIYLLRPDSAIPQRLPYDAWYLVHENMTWIPWPGNFLAASSQALSFTADGQVGPLFDERYLPSASADGAWLVFKRPPSVPGIGIYTSDGELIYEITGLGSFDVAWEGGSNGFYLFSPAAGLRFFDAKRRSLSVLNPAPGLRGGLLRLVDR